MRRVTATALVLALAMVATAARADDRRVAVDPNAAPWNAIAKVQTNTGGRCTGVLIAPSVVLTAAHCLYNRRTGALLRPVSLHVLLGYRSGGYRWHSAVTRIVVGSGFDGAKRTPQASDWARLDLADNAPTTPLALFDGAVAAGLPVALAGYNQDHAQLLMADLACHVVAVAPVGLARAGIAAPGQARFVTHDCAGTRGTSGGPLLARADRFWAVVGINIAAGREVNLALVPGVGN